MMDILSCSHQARPGKGRLLDKHPEHAEPSQPSSTRQRGARRLLACPVSSIDAPAPPVWQISDLINQKRSPGM